MWLYCVILKQGLLVMIIKWFYSLLFVCMIIRYVWFKSFMLSCFFFFNNRSVICELVLQAVREILQYYDECYQYSLPQVHYIQFMFDIMYLISLLIPVENKVIFFFTFLFVDFNVFFSLSPQFSWSVICYALVINVLKISFF